MSKHDLLNSLFIAIYNSNTNEAANLIKEHPNLARMFDDNGNTPICSAAYRGNIEIIKLLLAAGVDVNSHDFDSESFRSPLLHAIAGNKVDCVKFLLEKGANPNAADTFGHSALHKASAEVTRILLSQPGIITDPVTTETPETPLAYAIFAKDIDKTKMLLAAGADVNFKAKLGMRRNPTVIDRAKGMEDTPEEILNLLTNAKRGLRPKREDVGLPPQEENIAARESKKRTFSLLGR